MTKTYCDRCGREMPEPKRMHLQDITGGIKTVWAGDVCDVCRTTTKQDIEKVLALVEPEPAPIPEEPAL